MLAYLHPITGGLVVALLMYVGSLGLRVRNDRRRAGELLQRHRRWAPVLYWVLLATWVAGLASTWWLRPDLELGVSPHLEIGIVLVATMTGGAVTSRWVHRPEVRAIHPWFGAAAMLLAAAQVFFGLRMTP